MWSRKKGTLVLGNSMNKDLRMEKDRAHVGAVSREEG